MLNETIKALRKSKGLSQQELAVKVNVVRQTISKWEQGLSVPDSDLLIALSEALETPVSTLLGETVAESEADEVKALSEKLEIINLQFARRKAFRREVLHWSLIAFCALLVAGFAALTVVNSPYLGWDFSDPETAVLFPLKILRFRSMNLIRKLFERPGRGGNFLWQWQQFLFAPILA